MKQSQSHSQKNLSVTRFEKTWPIFFIFPAVLFVISFMMGRYSLTPIELFETIYYQFTDPSMIADPNQATVLFDIRIPRVIVVMLVGAGIGTAGAAYQGLFQNPLVSPDILGASAGASFGATLAILMFLPTYGIQAISFLFSVIAVFVATRFENVMKYQPILALVLGGMLVKSFFDAGVSITKYLSDPDDTLPAITFWLMGTFNGVKPKHILEVSIPLVVALFILFMNRQKLNVITFGETEASSMGVNTRRLRITTIAACTLITASSISICGQIGWVGLIIPHLARSLTGPNFRQLLPMSAILGASFLLICDTICRNAFSVELPIGILTSIIGIPFFVVIFKRKAKEFS
ncbi:MAG: iron ABC transporter permease [Coriobacteriia bacterium]|nr:iron ABC transporter permease [Coriobacteriia bacterium]